MIASQLVRLLNNSFGVVQHNDLVATDGTDAGLQLTRRQSRRSVVLYHITTLCDFCYAAMYRNTLTSLLMTEAISLCATK